MPRGKGSDCIWAAVTCWPGGCEHTISFLRLELCICKIGVMSFELILEFTEVIIANHQSLSKSLAEVS